MTFDVQLISLGVMQSLRDRATHPVAQEGTSPSLQSTLESYIEPPLPPPERYLVPDTGLHDADHRAFRYNYHSLSVEEKKKNILL